MSAVDDMQAWITSRFPDAMVRTTHCDDYEAVIIGTVALVVAGDLYAIGRVGRAIAPFWRLDITHAATRGSPSAPVFAGWLTPMSPPTATPTR